MEKKIWSPDQLKKQIEIQIAQSTIKERKGLSLKQILHSYNQFISDHVIKKRINPPFNFKILVIYYDLSVNEISERMIEFAKIIENENWYIFLKNEKLTSLTPNLSFNLKFKLCDDDLPTKYLAYYFTISSKPLDKSFERALYRSRSGKTNRLMIKQ